MAHPKSTNSNYRFIQIFSHQPLQLGRFLARFVALVINTFQLSKLSKIIQLNLQIAFPERSRQEINQLKKQAIKNELTSYFEFISIWGASNEKNIQRIQKIHGEHYFHEALAEKNGVVLIMPHLGTWEAMNAWLSKHTQQSKISKQSI